jgi:hypothetical protein
LVSQQVRIEKGLAHCRDIGEIALTFVRQHDG